MRRIKPRWRALIGFLAAIFSLLLTSTICAASGGPTDEQVCDPDADYALASENYSEAIRLHSRILDSDEGNALAHYHLGFAYGMVGRREQEIREYLHAVTLGLRQCDLFVNLGLAYLEQSDIERAVNALQTATMLGPNHSEPHFNLAVAYERAGKLHQARQEISLSLPLSPDDPDAYNTLAIIYIQLGAYQLAYDEWAYLVRTVLGYKIACANLVALGECLRSGSIQIPAVTRPLGRNRSRYEKPLLNDTGAPNSPDAAASEEECESNGMSNTPRLTKLPRNDSLETPMRPERVRTKRRRAELTDISEGRQRLAHPALRGALKP